MEDFFNNLGGAIVAVGFFLPILIGAVLKSNASDRVKAVVNIVVVAVAALVVQIQDNAGIFTADMAETWVKGLIVTITSYYGIWKPVGLGNLAPDKGIGPQETV